MVKLTAMPLPDPLDSRAVLIGTSSYEDSGLPPLPAAGRNVTRLADLLTHGDVWGLPSDHCRQVHDPGSDVGPGLAVAQAAAEAKDTLLVYLTGHGLVSRTGELVLATRSTAIEWPQFSGLRYSWVREAVAAARARRTIVVVDSCFSGRAVEAMADADSVLAGQWEIRGAYVLTATAANATALAPEGEPYTAFSASLFEALTGGWADGPEFLRLSDIFELIRKDMVRSGRPQPMQMSTSRIGELPLVRNAAWRHSTAAHARAAPMTAADAMLDRIDLNLRIVAYSSLPDLGQVDAQLAFIGMVNDGFRRAGLDSGRWRRCPAVGSEAIVMPAGSISLAAIVEMLVLLGASLDQHNRDRLPRAQLRLSADISMSPDPPVRPADRGDLPTMPDSDVSSRLWVMVSPALAQLINDADAVPGRLGLAVLDEQGGIRHRWEV